MEFDDVVILDFFCGLPPNVQNWWKKRFQSSSQLLEAEVEVNASNNNLFIVIIA